MECEMSTENVPVIWMQNKTPIYKSKKYHMETSGKIQRLIVFFAEAKDKSEITCQAKTNLDVLTTCAGEFC